MNPSVTDARSQLPAEAGSPAGRVSRRAVLLSAIAGLTFPRADSFGAPATRPASASIDDKARALLATWRERFDAERFRYVVAAPFVIAGDGTDAQIARYRDGTIVAAARALKAQFFRTPPDEPVLILLFEREGPYKRLAKKWFDDDAVPHYGFYRHGDRTMLMNVGTGTGTLVHELTHALIAPDFPDVPDWFNEGLASLYEQCSLGPGDTITGHPNWRLPALQQAIRDDKLRSVEAMIADDDFRADERVGINYAHARYLMYNLQEKKLLASYYARFRDARKADPTGVETLKRLIAPQPLDAFDRDWRAWVLTLQFPAR